MTLRGRLQILTHSPNPKKLHEFFDDLVSAVDNVTREKNDLQTKVDALEKREAERFGEPKINLEVKA